MRRAALALLALAVFLPSLASARTMFRCDVDLIVRESCCCPPKKAKPPSVPTMQRECCKLEKHSAAALPTATAVRAETVASPATTVIAIADAPALPRDVTTVVVPRAQAPPRQRSLLAQHCALLV